MPRSWGLFLALLCIISHSTAQDCESLVTCTDCITKNSSCSWCNDPSVFNRLASQFNSQLEPIGLCRRADLLDSSLGGCSNVVNPMGTIDKEDTLNSSDPTVTPQLVSLSLRPGLPQSFNISVSPPSSISVDMYILMDLSFTMRDDLQNLRMFSDELVRQMQNLTDEFRIGFGSFIDKPVSPFIDRNTNFSCAADYPAVAENDCEYTYAFRHRLDLTDNVDTFKTELANAKISGSVDQPEALLDALLQVAACQSEIGWRDVEDARRLVLVLTDGDYHMALDGKLAGLREQPDGKCHLDPTTKIYNQASLVDYPTSTMIAEMLNDQRIIPIFAVAKSVTEVYNQLSEIIRSAFVGEISANADNLLELIRNQYIQLSSTIVPVINGLDAIPELTMTAMPLNNCSNGTLISGDTCTNVMHPNTVQYGVSLELSSDYCKRSLTGRETHLLNIQFIGFGDVIVNVSGICSCGCEKEQVPSSPVCSSIGTYECSTCICPSNRNGPICQCPATAVGGGGCTTSSNSTKICSGRGSCVCNRCECNRAPNGQTYQGQFCECDPTLCPSGVHESGRVLPCSGHGVCGCDGICRCGEGFSGANCECTSDTDSCIAPADRNTGELCSGSGQCTCGTCLCSDYSVRFGLYCEECSVCARSCSFLSSCVRCHIEQNCPSSCNHVSIVSPNEHNNTDEELRTCSITEDNCEVTYQVGVYVLGTERNIMVVFDETQSDINDWSAGCSSAFPIFVIPLVVTIGIILLAIIVIALWVAMKYLIEYLEFRAWKKSQEDELWNTSGDNPLFVDPTTSHINPKYRPRTTVQVVGGGDD